MYMYVMSKKQIHMLSLIFNRNFYIAKVVIYSWQLYRIINHSNKLNFFEQGYPLPNIRNFWYCFILEKKHIVQYFLLFLLLPWVIFTFLFFFVYSAWLDWCKVSVIRQYMYQLYILWLWMNGCYWMYIILWVRYNKYGIFNGIFCFVSFCE